MSTSELWQPLSARQAGDRRWQEKVSPALGAKLREWIFDAGLSIGRPDLDRVPVRLALRLDVEPYEDGDDTLFRDRRARVAHALAYQVPDRVLLDIVDAFLDLLPLRPPPSKPSDPMAVRMAWVLAATKTDHRKSLLRLLDDARLIFAISTDGHRLVRRTDPASEAAFEDALAALGQAPASGSAADFLRSAWAAINALHPDGPRAYGDAIKAVEAAAHTVLEPNNSKATLGTMLRAFRDAPHRFTVDIGRAGASAGVETVIAMIDALWTGQTSRHGGQLPTTLETVEHARAAVHLATTLAAWFADSIVQRQPAA